MVDELELAMRPGGQFEQKAIPGADAMVPAEQLAHDVDAGSSEIEPEEQG
jgi:hypothetical protein